MGAKFANVHIKTTNIDLILKALRESYDKGPYNDDYSRGIFYIGEIKPGWVSILNVWFSWGSIKTFGNRLSRLIPTPIITVGYFDDDVFELSIHDHASVKNIAFCDDWIRSEYGIESDALDIETARTYLKVKDIAELNDLLQIEDPSVAIKNIEKLTGLPLWCKADWLEDNNEADSYKYIKYDLNDISRNDTDETDFSVEETLQTGIIQLLEKFDEQKLRYRISTQKVPIKSQGAKETLVLLSMTFESLMIFEYNDESSLQNDRENILKKAKKGDREQEVFMFVDRNIMVLYKKYRDGHNRTLDTLKKVFN